MPAPKPNPIIFDILRRYQWGQSSRGWVCSHQHGWRKRTCATPYRLVVRSSAIRHQLGRSRDMVADGARIDPPK